MQVLCAFKQFNIIELFEEDASPHGAIIKISHTHARG